MLVDDKHREAKLSPEVKEWISSPEGRTAIREAVRIGSQHATELSKSRIISPIVWVERFTI